MSAESFEKHAPERVHRYIEAFNARDLQTLGSLLSDGVSLIDWSLSVAGRDAVLESTENIVGAAQLEVILRNLIVSSPYVVADLLITVNGTATVEVLDLFTFDQSGRIDAIRAFKGQERPVPESAL